MMEVNGNDQILVHHGIDGQKWGTRKYQYEDGSLTPLGRIHYGVGEARDRSKIKMREERAKAKAEAKVVKAKAKAEIQKIRAAAKADAEMAKAKAEAYKAKKDADEQTERERIRADVEMDRNFGREQTRQMELQRQADKDLAKAQADAAVEQTKASEGKHTALKALGITLAAVGIGYLAYKAISSKQDSSTTKAATNIINKEAHKPAEELRENGRKIAGAAEKISANTIGNSATGVKAVKVAKAAKTAKTSKSGLFSWLPSNRAKASVYEYSKKHNISDLVYPRNTKNIQASKIAERAAKSGILIPGFEKLLKHGGYLKTGDKILIHSDELYHHGIKGQKWGVRRWQYEDGTLTPEGRAHYGRKEQTLNRQASGWRGLRNAYEMEKNFAPAMAIPGAFIGVTAGKAAGVGAAVGGPIGALVGAGLGIASAHASIKVTNFIAQRKQAKADEITKMLDEDLLKRNASDFVQNSKEYKEIGGQYKNEKEAREAYETHKKVAQENETNESKEESNDAYNQIKNEDLLTEQTVASRKDPKRAREAADLGLTALQKIGRLSENPGDDELRPGDNESRKWFVYEDQTIGLATIADLVNQGKTKSEIKKLMDYANKVDYDRSYEDGVFQLSWENGGFDHLEPFIDACIEVKNQERKTNTKTSQNSRSSSYTQLQNSHDELERKIQSEKDPLQKRFLQQELTQVTLKLNDELEKKNKQKYD